MQNGKKLNPKQISEFLKGSEEISFTAGSKAEIYSWVQGVLVAQEFAGQSKGDRGSIRAYIEKVTGLSVAQVTRLIRQYRETGMVGSIAWTSWRTALAKGRGSPFERSTTYASLLPPACFCR